MPEWLAAAMCVVAAFVIYGRLLLSADGFYATGDFPPAVSYAMNFVASVADGQWLPRWIVGTREFTFGGGSIDGTPPTIASPAFLYYAFLQSALSYPLLIGGVDPLKALQLIVCSSFGMAAWVLYRAGRTLGVGGIPALVGAYAYLVSPWLISNFYHRGGISEALAQAGLPFLVLAFSCLAAGRRPQAVLWSAVGIAWEALAHNVFLLQSATLCVLFTAVYMLVGLVRPRSGLVGRLEASWIIGGGVSVGLLAVAWQWYPVLLTLHDISFSYDGTLSTGHIVPLADLSGAFGWPRPFVNPDIGVTQPTDFFVTFGWWVVPAVVLLAIKKRYRRFRIALVACFIWFFSMAYAPDLLKPFVPTIFGATQFSFRLLSYLSVIGAIGVSLAWPRMPLAAGVAALVLMTVGQIPVLSHPMPMQRLSDAAYLGGYEYNAFYAHSPHEQSLRRWFDGWLDPTNSISFGDGMTALRLRGMVDPRLVHTSLYLASTTDSSRPASDVAQVEGDFDVTLVRQGGASLLRLWSTTTFDPTRQSAVDPATLGPLDRAYAVRPGRVSMLPADPSSYVFAEQMELSGSTGYWRQFQCRPAACADRKPDADGLYTVELPMIYNLLSVPTQEGKDLAYESDFNHRILVRAPRLDAPMQVSYRPPVLSLALTGLGVAGAIGVVALLLTTLRRG